MDSQASTTKSNTLRSTLVVTTRRNDANSTMPRSSHTADPKKRKPAHGHQYHDSVISGTTDYTQAGADERVIDPQHLRHEINRILESNKIGINPTDGYVPDDDLNDLITAGNIRAALGHNVTPEIVNHVIQYARKTFATLQLVFKEPKERRKAMEAFQSNGFGDASLDSDDLKVCDSCRNQQHCAHPFPMPDPWDKTCLKQFETVRWHFLVPMFEAEKFQYDFDSRRLLPFRSKSDVKPPGSGNFSDVSCVEMLANKQTAIQTPNKTTIIVALKTLRPLSVDAYKIEQEWRREAKAHQQLNGISSHLVRGIGAYRSIAKGAAHTTYHLVLEWANGGNLHSFWAENPQPQLDADVMRSRKRIKLVLGQLVGLAGALECMHNRTFVPASGGKILQDADEPLYQSPLSTPDDASALPRIDVEDADSELPPPSFRLESPKAGDNDMRLGVPSQELNSNRRHTMSENWRHGDIKPENILRFTEGIGEDWLGLLKLADLGRAQQHKLKTELRSTMERERWRTRWYEPPDLAEDLQQRTQGKISRLFDIWSMGCVIFESVLWMLYGWKAIGDFQTTDTTINENFVATPYWTKVGKGNYVVTARATQWIQHILKHAPEKDSSALGDLVILVRDKLLQIELPPDSERYTPGCRTHAKDMRDELVRIQRRALEDPEYLFDRVDQFEKQYPPVERAISREQGPGKSPDSWLQLPLSGSGRATTIAKSREYTNSMTSSWQYPDDQDFAESIIAGDQIPSDDVSLCETCGQIDLATATLTFQLEVLKANYEDCPLCALVLKALQRFRLQDEESLRLERALDCFVAKSKEGKSIKILRLCYSSRGKVQEARDAKIFDKSAVPSNDTTGIPMGAPELYSLQSDPKAGSSFMKLPSAWLKDCDHSHNGTCGQVIDDPQLPKRLIDVCAFASKIVDTTTLQPGHINTRYIAFSHRWCEMPAEAKTTAANLESRKRKLPKNDMPQNFTDAIAVTKALGCRYLWIDCLCINQGPDGDFAEQAKSMQTIFSNAYCVIAAASADGAKAGFLNADRLPLHSAKIGEVYASAVTNDFERDVLESTLNQRGWVIQERALARRTIFFTGTQMYWECGDSVRCETLRKLKQ
jgi:serine/threonine protein kinase